MCGYFWQIFFCSDFIVWLFQQGCCYGILHDIVPNLVHEVVTINIKSERLRFDFIRIWCAGGNLSMVEFKIFRSFGNQCGPSKVRLWIWQENLYWLVFQNNSKNKVGRRSIDRAARAQQPSTNRAPNKPSVKVYICPRKHILGQKWPFLGQTS